MALGSNDYELKLFSNWGTTDLNNTFYYIDVTEGSNSGELATGFIADVLPAILAVVSASTHFSRIYVKSLLNTSDFYDAEIDFDGSRGSVIGNPIERWYFKYLRNENGYNDGKKLIGMLADDDVVDGHIQPVLPPPVADCATALASEIFSGEGSFVPANGRYLRHEPDEEHEKVWYTLDFLEVARDVFFIRVSHKVG